MDRALRELLTTWAVVGTADRCAGARLDFVQLTAGSEIVVLFSHVNSFSNDDCGRYLPVTHPLDSSNDISPKFQDVERRFKSGQIFFFKSFENRISDVINVLSDNLRRVGPKSHNPLDGIINIALELLSFRTTRVNDKNTLADSSETTSETFYFCPHPAQIDPQISGSLLGCVIMLAIEDRDFLPLILHPPIEHSYACGLALAQTPQGLHILGGKDELTRVRWNVTGPTRSMLNENTGLANGNDRSWPSSGASFIRRARVEKLGCYCPADLTKHQIPAVKIPGHADGTLQHG